MTKAKAIRCPFCSLIVICDDETHTFRHAAPVCDRFTEAMKRFGMVGRREPWAAVVQRKPEGA